MRLTLTLVITPVYLRDGTPTRRYELFNQESGVSAGQFYDLSAALAKARKLGARITKIVDWEKGRAVV